MPGAVVILDRDATPQLTEPITMRVTRTEPSGQDPEWVWVIGYHLDTITGEAIERREVYARVAGIKAVRECRR